MMKRTKRSKKNNLNSSFENVYIEENFANEPCFGDQSVHSDPFHEVLISDDSQADPELNQLNENEAKKESLPQSHKQERIIRLSVKCTPIPRKRKLSKEAKTAKKLLIKQKNESKKNRETGRDYLGYRRSGSTIKQDVNRSARKQLDTCSSKFCHRSAVRHCNLFSETERSSIFQCFWKMNWSQKKFYVCNLIESNSTKKKHYYLNKSNNKKLQVCRKMFLNTFGIKAKMLRGWLNSRGEFGFFENPDDVQQRKVEKKQQSEKFKENESRKDYLREFLVRFPKLESHYCRKDSEKEYFQTEHRTITSLYGDYEDFCEVGNEKKLSITTFSSMIKQLNYSLFKPRKDQCDTCVAYKVGNLSETEFRDHRAEIAMCRKEKEKDVKDGEHGLCILLCQDVEAVQLCPKLLASALYFKLKLQMHNFTIFDIISHKSTNYIWDETQGEVKASTFVSIVVKHISELVKNSPPLVPVIIYSDGCGYQNRNAILSSALSQLAMKSSITIIQKFLVKGHTQMECDSSHALIERKTRGMTVDVPEDFVEAVRAARSKPFPLDVQSLDHTFFYNYDDPDIMSYESIRPGKRSGDPTVNDLRCLKYTSDGKIYYKLSFEHDYKVLPQNRREVVSWQPKKLYASRLAISSQKFKDLQELKIVLRKSAHEFYDNLSHEPKKRDKSVAKNLKL